MTQHPYVGLAGTCSGRSGVVAAVGPVTRDGDSFIALYLLIDRGLTCEYDVTDFTPDDPAEARRRLTESTREWSGPDAYEARFEAIEIAVPGETDAPADYEAIGPWEPGPVWIYPDWQTPQGMTIPMPVRDWRRPLRRVQG